MLFPYFKNHSLTELGVQLYLQEIMLFPYFKNHSLTELGVQLYLQESCSRTLRFPSSVQLLLHGACLIVLFWHKGR